MAIRAAPGDPPQERGRHGGGAGRRGPGGNPRRPSTGTPPSAALVASDLTTCAGLYVKLALAKFKARFTGDQSEVTYLENQISFSVCDPLWAEALVDYGEFLAQGGTIPYVNYPPGEIGSFAVLDTLPDQPSVTVALLADWGTGMEDAEALLTQVKAKNPDVVIHLGDIYYAGTAGEVQSNFLAVYGGVFGAPGTPGVPPLYSLSGNHDMYSGGAGYYGMLTALGQPASYFCLRNADWQLLAMDTGLNDRDPFTVLTNLTYLNPPEVPWQQDKLVNAAGRKTILLSHHQLFSAFDSVGQDVEGQALAWNPNLQAAFTRGGQSLLPQAAYWFWGHEHNLEIYQPYIGLARGRCIGAGACLVERRLVGAGALGERAGQRLAPRRIRPAAAHRRHHARQRRHRLRPLLRHRRPGRQSRHRHLLSGPGGDRQPGRAQLERVRGLHGVLLVFAFHALHRASGRREAAAPAGPGRRR